MIKIYARATAPAITLAEAKSHLRVTVADDDLLISALSDAATLDAEHIMGRAVMPQKWQVTLDAFEASMQLQRPTVTAIDSIKYIDTTGALVTLAPSVYQLVVGDYSARVVLAYAQAWPTTRSQPEAVQIIFSCGYADAASVPESIKAWIKLRLGALYENREEVSVAQRVTVQELPFVDGLLDRYKVWAL